MLPCKALVAAIRGLRSIIRDRKRSKLFGECCERGRELRERVKVYGEIDAMWGVLLEGGSVAHYAYELGWEPPIASMSSEELNRLASAWLDQRWKKIEEAREADAQNTHWRKTDGE